MSGGDEDGVLKWPSDFSDGNSSKWPGAGSALVQADTSNTAKTWLQKTGQVIAAVLKRESKHFTCSPNLPSLNCPNRARTVPHERMAFWICYICSNATRQ
jgi:hypothetical protein